MKVILRTDVENLGRLGDMVEVKPGYGRNYLLPQGYAMLATSANEKVFELERKKLQAKTEALRGAAASLAEKIAATPLTIAMRVGDNDKLYGSVTSALIAEALEAKGIEIDRRRILLDAPVRALGDYIVRVRLHADVVAELSLAVVAEKSHYEEEEEAAARAASAASEVSAASAASEESDVAVQNEQSAQAQAE
ncbi:MAG: 50S ribosomal protein L9 [Desulfovibrio sp.]|jgi:large subunit ribosomal protein L9|nr:50S ribosomal protein L9 [Desulfovibrio sp.]